jgi:glutamate-ammonia-ligase adenylyltransferase
MNAKHMSCLRVGFLDAKAFLQEYEKHRKFVFDFYKGVFSHLGAGKDNREDEKPLAHFIRSGRLSEQDKKFLAEAGFKDLEAASRNLISLAQGENASAFIKAQLSEGFLKFLPLFLDTLKKAFDADQALIRFERFVSAYQIRDSFFALLAENLKMMELLVSLFGISPFLTEVLIHQPALLESLIESEIERGGLDEERHERCLIQMESSPDLEVKLNHLILYKNFELLRQGTRNILGLSSCMDNVHELSLLAERVLQDAFDTCMGHFSKKRSMSSFPFAVIGLGKLGGQELGYASDLDLLFVTSGDVDGVDRATQFGTLYVDFLSKAANAGSLYKIDTRLRPDGSKGPLVASLDGLKKYYRESSEIWERMAMSRARCIAGDEALGQEAMQILEKFIFRNIPDSEQVSQIRNIRERIFEDRCSRLPDGFDVKSGKGGLIEIEFLAQFLQLKHGEQMRGQRQTHTLKLLQTLSHVQAITREELGLLVDAYLYYREIENALRLVKERPTDFVPHEDEWAVRIQRKMGLDPDPSRFFEKLLRHTQVVRHIYERYIQP